MKKVTTRPKRGRPTTSESGRPKISAGYRLTPEAVDALAEIADANGETKAEVLERIILRARDRLRRRPALH